MTGNNPIIYVDNDKNFQLPYKILENGDCWLRPICINISNINRFKLSKNEKEKFLIEIIWADEEKLYAKTLNFLDIDSIANNTQNSQSQGNINGESKVKISKSV